MSDVVVMAIACRYVMLLLLSLLLGNEFLLFHIFWVFPVWTRDCFSGKQLLMVSN